MKCDDVNILLDAYADNELDLISHQKIEQHLIGCASCRVTYENLTAVKKALADDSLYFRGTDDLQTRIRTATTGTQPSGSTGARTWQWRWIPALAGAAVIALILFVALGFLQMPGSSDDLLAKEIVSAHVRSMMVGHLTDVPSTDQHMVKPWFEGKLDFSPPVPDLTAQGFTLIGGRLDYAASRPVAALIYQRRQHVINLFVFPTQNESAGPDKMIVQQGFNLIHWNRAGMTYWAVSDLNLNELREFAQDLKG